MKVLVACEESQRVCTEIRKLGHEAYSCDVIDCSGGHPEWHIKQDVLPLINGNCKFNTVDGAIHTISGQWDLLIAHPPCTYLTVSGNRWFDVEKYGDKARLRIREKEKAIEFFMCFASADCNRIAIENPIGVMSTHWRKPDQIIQPYEFGDHARKKTCLWLKGVNPLRPTNVVDPGDIEKGGYSVGANANYARDDDGKILRWNDPKTAVIRSKTFPGIARAIAEQWAGEQK